MSRRKRGQAISGIVLLDKPAGMTSNRALQKVRGLFDARKAGHTGNLDPFATGLLPICFGEASKTAAWMLDSDKAYHAVAHLGSATDTGDIDGVIIEECSVPDLSSGDVRSAMGAMTGTIDQVPPMYSALKHKGQPLYKLAREGKTVERKPRQCTIHELELIHFEGEMLEFRVRCSKGTYVRTLAEDLARALGTCAHLLTLRRLQAGPFDETGMVTLDQLEAAASSGTLNDFLLPVDAGLLSWPSVSLQEGQVARFSNGNPQQTDDHSPGMLRVYSPDGTLLGLAERDMDGLVRPVRVFNLRSDSKGDLTR